MVVLHKSVATLNLQAAAVLELEPWFTVLQRPSCSVPAADTDTSSPRKVVHAY